MYIIVKKQKISSLFFLAPPAYNQISHIPERKANAENGGIPYVLPRLAHKRNQSPRAPRLQPRHPPHLFFQKAGKRAGIPKQRR